MKLYEINEEIARLTDTVLVDEETGEIIPTDGRNRKDKIKEPKEPDYKALYEKLQKKCTSQEILIRSLKDEIRKLKEQ